MALPHQSIATISSPEFINLQPLDVNPFMSKCEIKVLYVGENRNRSYISKQVATQMAKTLRGAPIVGYYKEDKQDFADHGHQMIWDDEGVHFNVLTKPYGFVSPDADVWFQKFTDEDDFGNQIEREYLMTTGFLWTGQFEEAQSVLDGGKPQSMELDENSLDGHWATNVKNNIEFFIINDAVFTKLCILGDDVEPCFEGASITVPETNTTFSKTVDNNFKRTLFSMMNELQDALKGGNGMAQEVKTPVEDFELEQENLEPVNSDSELENSESQTTPEDTFENVENQEGTDEFINDSDVENTDFEKKEEEKDTSEDEENSNKDEDEDEKNKYSLLEQQYEELSTQYTQLKEEYDSLVEFKQSIENEKKDALIAEFYMLSDEDKKDIIEHKTEYSLDEIKAKLAVICFEKKVNFNSDNSNEIDNEKEQEVITYTFNEESTLPDWVKAVKDIEKDDNE